MMQISYSQPQFHQKINLFLLSFSYEIFFFKGLFLSTSNHWLKCGKASNFSFSGDEQNKNKICTFVNKIKNNVAQTRSTQKCDPKNIESIVEMFGSILLGSILSADLLKTRFFSKGARLYFTEITEVPFKM